MDGNKTKFARSIRWSWMLVGGGILLLLIGVAVRLILPSSSINPKWVETFGIFFTGWGGVSVARYILAARDPVLLQRLENEEQDERVQDIRRRAGNSTFLGTLMFSSLSLLVYSMAVYRPDPDPLWWYLAVMVIGPGLVYIAYLLKFTREL